MLRLKKSGHRYEMFELPNKLSEPGAGGGVWPQTATPRACDTLEPSCSGWVTRRHHCRLWAPQGPWSRDQEEVMLCSLRAHVLIWGTAFFPKPVTTARKEGGEHTLLHERKKATQLHFDCFKRKCYGYFIPFKKKALRFLCSRARDR